MSQILIFDDVAEIGEMLCEFSQRAGFDSIFYQQFTHCSEDKYQNAAIIILDLNMPGHDGIDVIEELGRLKISAPIILCSGVAEDIIDSSIDILIDSGLIFGAKLLKPFSYEQFKTAIANAGRQAAAVPLSKPMSNVNLTRGDLDISLKRGWFSQVFQPQIDVASNTIFGVECLARLNHPLFGTCYPDSFIDKLVDYNLMDMFTLQQVENALSTLSTINLPDAVRVSLNLDPSSLHKDFLANLEAILSQSNFSPSQICLEITELSAVELSREVKALLAKLRMRGFHVSLDDFGTGFSTIKELDVLPFNEIKIDRSFVANMHERKGSLAIVKHTIALAADMNLLVIGEGIETEQQASIMQALGCHYLQGFLFSRPLDIHALKSFVQQFPQRVYANQLNN